MLNYWVYLATPIFEGDEVTIRETFFKSWLDVIEFVSVMFDKKCHGKNCFIEYLEI